MALLEPDLKRALRRQPAPAGFAERVLSRLPAAERHTPQAHLFRLRLAWSLASALLLCVGFFANHHRIERRNEAARQRLVESLTLAGRQIVRAESKVFAGSAWARMKERVEQIEAPASDRDEPMHSPATKPRT
jgi:hypothetical protein